MRKLLIDPFSQTQVDLPKRLVVVIDALDECDDDIIAYIVELLATTLEKYDPSVRIRLRFLVTSRPEPHLLKFFTKLHTPSFDLSTVDLLTGKMIFVFSLKTGYETWLLPLQIGRRNRRRRIFRLLAKISGGVFVAARIAVDYVAFGESPNSQLQKMHRVRHLSGLDVVYRLVLDTIVQEESVRTSFGPLSDSYSFIHSTFETGVSRPSARGNCAS